MRKAVVWLVVFGVCSKNPYLLGPVRFLEYIALAGALGFLPVLSGNCDRPKPSLRLPALAVALLFLCVVASVFLSEFSDETLRTVAYFSIGVCLFGILPFLVRDSEDAVSLLWALATVSCVQSVAGLYLYATVGPQIFLTWHTGRFGLALGQHNANYQATVFLLGLSASLFLMSRPERSSVAARCAALFCVGASIVGVVMTFSRTALALAVLLCLCALVWAFASASNRLRALVATATATVIGATAALSIIAAFPEVGDYLVQRISPDRIFDDQDRGSRWRGALLLIEERPYGVGIGNVLDAEVGGSAHNVFLETAMETGLQGAVALAFVYASILFPLAGALRRSTSIVVWGLAACGGVVLLQAMTLDFLNERLFWLALSLCAIASALGRQSDPRLNHEQGVVAG